MKTIIVLLLVLLAGLNIIAGTDTFQLDELSQNDWNNYIIVIADIAEMNDGNMTSITVKNMLHGPYIKPDTLIKVRFNPLCQPSTPGKYALILQKNAEILICGYNNILLGLINNFYKILPQSQEEIVDLYIIVDTARISISALKWQRLNELSVRMKDSQLVMRYVIDAQVLLMKKVRQEWLNTLICILTNYHDYSISVIISADKTYITNGGEEGKQWSISNDRKSLFTNIINKTDKDSPEYSYIENNLQTIK